jgi:hypothetical protein
LAGFVPHPQRRASRLLEPELPPQPREVERGGSLGALLAVLHLLEQQVDLDAAGALCAPAASKSGKSS